MRTCWVMAVASVVGSLGCQRLTVSDLACRSDADCPGGSACGGSHCVSTLPAGGGEPCGFEGSCADGLTCNAADICVPSGQARCDPECPAFSTCVKQQCKPICTGRACAAGQTCVDSSEGGSGQCIQQSLNTVGGPCHDGSGCPAVGAKQTFCLVPYGSTGSSPGVCSVACREDADCAAVNMKCREFPSIENGAKSAKLCADVTFAPCTKETDCSTSGLTCGVYVSPDKTAPHYAIAACRTPTQPTNLGATCMGGVTCSTGLCARSGSARYCTVPCATADDCTTSGFPNDTNGSPALCAAIGVEQDLSIIRRSPLPTAPAKVCIRGPTNAGTACTIGKKPDGGSEPDAGAADGGSAPMGPLPAAQCGSDAPDCTLSGGTTDRTCTTPCTPPSGLCPVVGQLCNSVGDGGTGYCSK